ncbi:transposable element gene [Prunus dulcis]|uniref:Transposable element protein n=1 Tax=Prunus dulcis TaxID=3755 RepID=A0A4Y1RSF9_PRUDU|nr:transposable element gene [Prunus dulcis]
MLKQSVVSQSSAEAEYRAMASTATEIVWLRWLLQDMGVSLFMPTPMYCAQKCHSNCSQLCLS